MYVVETRGDHGWEHEAFPESLRAARARVRRLAKQGVAARIVDVGSGEVVGKTLYEVFSAEMDKEGAR